MLFFHQESTCRLISVKKGPNVDIVPALLEAAPCADQSQHNVPARQDVVALESPQATEAQPSTFSPQFTDQLIPQNESAGWIGSRVVRRELLGRRLETINPLTKEVVIGEFYRPSGGYDYPLFGHKVAEPHSGYTGLEGYVTKTMNMKTAEKLVFTSQL